MGFVFCEEIVAKSAARRVKNDAEIFGLIVFQNAAEDVVEQEGNLGGHARRGIHAVHRGEEGAVNVGHGIDKKELLARRSAKKCGSGLRRRHCFEYSKASSPNRIVCG